MDTERDPMCRTLNPKKAMSRGGLREREGVCELCKQHTAPTCLT